MDASRDFSCLVPEWPFGEGLVDLAIVGSSGSVAIASETQLNLPALQPFRFVGYWTDLSGPTSGSALGGDRLNITWLINNETLANATAAYSDWAHAFQPAVTYQCLFQSDSGHSQTADIVVESVSCFSCCPELPQCYRTTSILVCLA